MPMQSVRLRPGVDIERTPSMNEAGISDSQLIRTKNGLTQTMGGWTQYSPTIPSTVRSLHAWQDIAQNQYGAAAGTNNLVVLGSSQFYRDITPSLRTSSLAPSLNISSGSSVVTVNDINAGLSIGSVVWVRTPIAIGNLLIQGSYGVVSAPSTGQYTINSSVIASTTLSSAGTLPTFTAVANSNIVTVTLSNHTQGTAPTLGLRPTYDMPTSVGGLTIQGAYIVNSISDSTSYTIISPTAASSGNTVTMNGGNARLDYYVALNNPAGAMGFGQGAYGGGAYGSGAIPAAVPGLPIVSSDWTQDNFGENLLGIQADGPVFYWSPDTQFNNAVPVAGAPLRNGGGFISMPQQILVLWKSCQVQGNGGFNSAGTQDNLLVRWSAAQDYTSWQTLASNAAGSFKLPSGSVIRGGLQAANYGVIWTDIECWVMQYLGNDPVSVFNFTKAGAGCGLVGKHAAGVIQNMVFWVGDHNIYVLASGAGGGVQALPCSVWDFIFQGKNPTQDAKIMCATNSEFNEVSFHFCYGAATENNAYVKYNLVDQTWDKGFMSRSAWKDVSVLGAPLGAESASGIVFQHEMGNLISGAGNSYFTTGWWSIADGQDLGFVDWVLPDFVWGTIGNTDAQVQLQFLSANYPGDTPTVYGPFTVTKASQYVNLRLRGRLMAMQVISATNNVFWRLGLIRFRWAPGGRR